jgi:hypothetical protein
MAMQPWMLTKLSDISNGEAEADGTDVERMLASIRDPSMPLYDRGLCCAALGATIKLRRSRTVLRDISIMDALIDMIGQTSNADHATLGMSAPDLYNIRVNCCVLLSTIMAAIADSTAGSGAVETKEPEQDIIPMQPAPMPPGKAKPHLQQPASPKGKSKRRGKKANKEGDENDATGGRRSGSRGGSRRPATSSQAEAALAEGVSTPSDFKRRGGGGSHRGPGAAGSLAESYGSSRRMGSSRGWGLGMLGLDSPPMSPDEAAAAEALRTSTMGRLTSPKHLYALGTSSVTPLGHEDGGDPQARRGGREAGFLMSTTGEYRQHIGRVPTVTQRTGVLFGDEMPNDAAVSYCGVPAREIVTFIRVRAVMVF